MKKYKSLFVMFGFALTMLLLAALMPGNADKAYAMTGYGTSASPYLIESEADWNEFAQNVNNENNYSGRIIRLTEDITVNEVAGSNGETFNGIFDGQGHTITLDYQTEKTYIAPFRYVNGASFFNLTVAGNITTSEKFAAGFTGKTTGDVLFISCRSSVAIHSDVKGDATHGGFVAESRGSNTTFINCLFDGSISGNNTSNCGGFVGWTEYGGVYIRDSLFAGSMSTKTDGCGTFLRQKDGTSNTVKHSYYRSAYGATQGEQTNKTGEELKAQLGDGWILAGENVIPKIEEKGPIKGDGKADSPYLIETEADWIEMAHRVNNGYSFARKNLRLTDDISVSTMVGSSDHKFYGAFYGDGHTITFNDNSGVDYTAPFRYVNGAFFYDLNVSGSIVTSKQHAAGIVGSSAGETSFVSCRSSIHITSSVNGEGTHGGLVAMADGSKTSFRDCLFDGSISGNNTTGCGGFVGWPGDNKVSFFNCLNTGSYATAKADNVFTNCGTFSREKENAAENITVINSYYKTAYGALQGEQTDKTGAELKALLGDGWKVDGDQVIPVKAGEKQLEGDGTVESPYLIENVADWELFALQVNGGNPFIGKVLRLTNDITLSSKSTITPMAGTSGNPFSGVFDGDGHKITVNYTVTEDHAAPFRFTKEATIYNVNVDGTIITSRKFTAGLIGQAKGETAVISCRSSVHIVSSVSGDGTHAGLAAIMDGSDGSIEFTDCLFDGKISGSSTNNCGGFLGWPGSNKAIFTNCLNNGTFETSTDGCGTFSREPSANSVTVNNSYYKTAYGALQGEQTNKTGAELKALLGVGWTERDPEVVPQKAGIPNFEPPVLHDYDIIRFSGIDWVVLDADHASGYATEDEYNAGGEKSRGLFLITKDVFASTVFRKETDGEYEGSAAQEACTNFYQNKIKDACKSAVLGVKTKEEGTIDSLQPCDIDGTGSDAKDNVFLLSALEYAKYNGSTTQAANIPEVKTFWWLRSIREYRFAGCVTSNPNTYNTTWGYMSNYWIGSAYGADLRPAVNLNLDNLIYFENPEYLDGGSDPKWIVKTPDEAVSDSKEELQAAMDKAEKKRDYIAKGYTNESKQAVTEAVEAGAVLIAKDYETTTREKTLEALAEIDNAKAAVEQAASNLTEASYKVSDTDYTIKAGDEINAGDIDFSASKSAGKGYFGSPLFRVLKVEDGRMLLMSEYLWGGGKGSGSLGNIRFAGNDSNEWNDSLARDWCGAFDEDILSQITGLKVCDVPGNITDKEYTPGARQLSGDPLSYAAKTDILTSEDKVFFLSGEEACEFMKEKQDRITKLFSDGSAGDASGWWLRSAVKGNSDVGCMMDEGAAGSQAAGKRGYVRPVFWAELPGIDANSISKSTESIEGTERTVYTLSHEHSWGEPTYTWSDDNSNVTAKRVCTTDAKHVEEETVDTTSAVTKEATCETKGETTYTADFNSDVFVDQTKTVDDIAALGHDYRYTGMTWEEKDGGGYNATANFVCNNDAEHTEAVAATVTSETTDSTCQTAGITTYTATASFEEKTYTDIKTEGIDVKAHNWGETVYTWSNDGSVCVAKRSCENGGCNAFETEMGAISSEVKTPATYEAKGTTTYTATFENTAFEPQTKDIEDIPVLEPDAAAQTAVNKIKGLPDSDEITAADKRAVEAARKAYDNLTEDQKKSIPAAILKKLEDAEAALATAEQQEQEEAERKAREEAEKKAQEADARARAVTVVTVNVKVVNAKAIDRAVAKAGGSDKYVTKIVLGKKVKKIRKGAFANYKRAKILVVKTRKLKKSTVKKSLKGSAVTGVQVKVGTKKANKQFVKKYKKIFTRKNCGRKVRVR